MCLVGHLMRDPEPCLLFLNTDLPRRKDEPEAAYKKRCEIGIFFFPDGQKCDLSLHEVLKVFADPLTAYTDAKAQLLSPEGDEESRNKLIDVIAICGWLLGSKQYKEHVMRVLNETKRDQLFFVEQRGNKTGIFSRGLPEEVISELKERAGF